MSKRTALCYHYLLNHELSRFSRIKGNQMNEFYQFVKMIKSNAYYNFINPTQLESTINEENQILLTFDDGLTSHYKAAEILAANQIKAIFFVCTSIYEHMPANPIIIHHMLSEFGLKFFLEALNKTLYQINEVSRCKMYQINDNYDVYKNTAMLKYYLKHILEPQITTSILQTVYREHFIPRYGDDISNIHLSPDQIKKINEMGHCIGCHTHNHIPINEKMFSNKKLFHEQVVASKKILEKELNKEIIHFAYPFGGSNEQLYGSDEKELSQYFKYMHTVTDDLEAMGDNHNKLGRYCVESNELIQNKYPLLYKTMDLVSQRQVTA